METSYLYDMSTSRGPAGDFANLLNILQIFAATDFSNVFGGV
jgi:hypothetical protein